MEHTSGQRATYRISPPPLPKLSTTLLILKQLDSPQTLPWSDESKRGTRKESTNSASKRAVTKFKSRRLGAPRSSNLGVDLEAEAARVGGEEPAQHPGGRRLLLRRRRPAAARRPAERPPRGRAARRHRRWRRRQKREQQDEVEERKRQRWPHGEFRPSRSAWVARARAYTEAPQVHRFPAAEQCGTVDSHLQEEWGVTEN